MISKYAIIYYYSEFTKVAEKVSKTDKNKILGYFYQTWSD